MAAGNTNSGLFIAVKAASIGHEATAIDGGGQAYGRGRLRGRVHTSQSVLRAAWASWGGSIACTVTINGRRILSRVAMKTHGVYALPTDFDGGVAALAGGVGMVSALGDYERTSRGYLFALFAPRTAWKRVDDPGGQIYHESLGGPPVVISRSSNGKWRYSLRAFLDESIAGSVLWILELPE